MIEHWRTFAAYNAWANRRLYAACGQLPPEDFQRDGGVFFGSLSATLNHLLVTDRIWMARFRGEPPAPYALDTVLFHVLPELWAARAEEDRRIAAWVDGLDDAALAGVFTYARQTSPERITQPLGQALAHLFNHQTHHRGQAHGLLTQFAGPFAAPPLDLAYFQRVIAAE